MYNNNRSLSEVKSSTLNSTDDSLNILNSLNAASITLILVTMSHLENMEIGPRLKITGVTL